VLIEPRLVQPLPGLDLRYRVLSVYRNMLYAGSLQYNGMIVANIDVKYLEGLITDGARQAGGTFRLIDADRRVLAEAGIRTDRSPIRTEAHFKRYPFTLVSDASSAAYYRLPRTLAFTSGVLIMLSLAAGILAAYVLSRRSFRSIAAVVDIIRAAENDTPLPEMGIPPTSGSHQLVYSILKTFVERRFLKVQLSEKELREKTLELLALQSQTNPHFLYNALTTIAFKTIQYTGGPNDATRMVNHLSRILEYSLADPEREATLEDEISHVRNYVAIQEYRYRDLFRVDWDLNPEALSCDSIKMLVQPLVENVIDHGLRALGRRGTIAVRCLLRGGAVRLIVEDDGVGMGPEKLAELRGKIESDHVGSDSIGLVNTCRRLRLRYGNAGRYDISSEPGKGTTVTLEFPAERTARLPKGAASFPAPDTYRRSGSV
jgi:two-component system sensor histidine kinase YesM